MNYLLTVLSTGREEYLQRTLAALDEHLSPQPAERFVYTDADRLGQCAAHKVCWDYAANSDYEWVLMQEEDYVLLRPIDVWDMMTLMDAKPHLLGLTLMRTPWLREVEYGGFVPQTPGWYKRCQWRDIGGHMHEWIETTRNWANAPTLLRTSLAREFPWPAEPGCETAVGPLMLAKYPEGRFGLYGAGECQVAHIGVERAPRSHGY